jgi:diguanylate cyclase (GGDEF)-like protein
MNETLNRPAPSEIFHDLATRLEYPLQPPTLIFDIHGAVEHANKQAHNFLEGKGISMSTVTKGTQVEALLNYYEIRTTDDRSETPTQTMQKIAKVGMENTRNMKQTLPFPPKTMHCTFRMPNGPAGLPLEFIPHVIVDRGSKKIAGLSIIFPSVYTPEKDDSTGLHTRRFFDEHLARLVQQTQKRESAELAVMMVRIEEQVDPLASVSKESTKLLVQSLLEIIRPYDTCAQYGESQYAVILPRASETNAYQVIARLLKALRGNTPDTGSFSHLHIGVASLALIQNHSQNDTSLLIMMADYALNEARKKSPGKTSAVTFSMERPANQLKNRHT